MKTIQFNSNFGRFAYTSKCTIDPEVFMALPFIDETSSDGEKALATAQKTMQEKFTNLALQGVANTCFRGMSSEVEKALVEAKLMTKETKRSEVPYSQEAAAIVQKEANAKLAKLCTKDGLPVIQVAVTGEHVFDSGDKVTKEAEALWTQVQALVGEKFEGALKKLGLGEDYDDESGMLACKKHLQAAKARAAAAAKSELSLG